MGRDSRSESSINKLGKWVSGDGDGEARLMLQEGIFLLQNDMFILHDRFKGTEVILIQLRKKRKRGKKFTFFEYNLLIGVKWF